MVKDLAVVPSKPSTQNFIQVLLKRGMLKKIRGTLVSRGSREKKCRNDSLWDARRVIGCGREVDGD